MIDISPIQVLIVLVIALLVFGPQRLPEMARGLARGIQDFRRSLEDGGEPQGRPSAPPAPRGAAGGTGGEGEEPDDDLAGVIVPGSRRPDGAG